MRMVSTSPDTLLRGVACGGWIGLESVPVSGSVMRSTGEIGSNLTLVKVAGASTDARPIVIGSWVGLASFHMLVDAREGLSHLSLRIGRRGIQSAWYRSTLFTGIERECASPDVRPREQGDS